MILCKLAFKMNGFSLVSIAVLKQYDQKQLGEERVDLSFHKGESLLPSEQGNVAAGKHRD